jgi:histone arginine demethylase JMJD6
MGSGGESDPALMSDAPSFLGLPAVNLERLSVRDVAPGVFERTHVDRAVPAVLTDVATHWPCAEKWTLEWFKEKHGDVRVAADDGTKEKMKCTLREFVKTCDAFERGAKSSSGSRLNAHVVDASAGERVRSSAPQCHRPLSGVVPYLRTWNFLDDLPELENDLDKHGGGYFRDLFHALRPEWRPPFTWAFLGAKGTRTKLHVDVWHTDAWLTVLQGSKRFVLFHPGHAKHVFDENTRSFADLDGDDVAAIEKTFPNFRRATPVVAVVGTGETIYIPRGWPHYAVALSAGVSLTKNFLSRANRRAVLEETVAFANRRDACAFVLGRAPRASDNLLKFCVHGGSLRLSDAAKVMGVETGTLREKMREARRQRLREEAEAAEAAEGEEEEA